MDRSQYVESASKAWEQLGEFEQRTVLPAPGPHLYIGGIVRAVRAMLVGPVHIAKEFTVAEVKAGVPRSPDNDLHLHQAIQAVNRSFPSNIHMGVEIGLTAICRDEGWTVEIGQAKRVDGIIHRIRQKDTNGVMAAEWSCRSTVAIITVQH